MSESVDLDKVKAWAGSVRDSLEGGGMDTRGLANGLFDALAHIEALVAEVERLRACVEHKEAESKAIFAMHSDAVDERDALRRRLGIVHPMEAAGRVQIKLPPIA